MRVGHAQKTGDGWRSGVTVIVPPPGTIGAVDVRGGGPGTHETDALDPTTLVPTVDAVTLTGGSAFGLSSARGVQTWCLEQGLGFAAGPEDDPRGILVPIVPAAAIFDLGRGGDVSASPGPEMGYEAASHATDGDFARGSVGAGTGALMASALQRRGGIGTAAIRLDGGVVVGALAVVNAFGSPFDPVTGALLGAAFIPPGLPRPNITISMDGENPRTAGPDGTAANHVTPNTSLTGNTTLAVVVTNARLDGARTRRMATAAHDGIARAVSPAHILVDGDTIFGLATGEIELPDLRGVMTVQAAAADAVLLAILDAVRVTA